jgi:hypothetical protein
MYPSEEIIKKYHLNLSVKPKLPSLWDFKVGDSVEVLTLNAKVGKDIWHDAEVVEVRKFENYVRGKDCGYPVVFVKLMRTYCRAIEGSNDLEFFTKEAINAFLYMSEIKPKN